MNLPYHIHYRPYGQRGSEVHSITCKNSAGGFASGPFVRKLWESMKASLYRDGYMSHPDTNQRLEFASLHFGGYEVHGNAMGGEMVQKWDEKGGVQVIREPEPHLYSMAAKMAAANVPEQPEPQYEEIPPPAEAPAPLVEEKPKRTRKSRIETKEEV